MQDNAQRAFPTRTVNIVRIERGTLNSLGRSVLVDYRNSTRQSHVLNDIPGVRATVTVSGIEGERYIYSLQQCANDVRSGAGISDEGIVFTPTEVFVPQPAQQASGTNEIVPGVVGSGSTDLTTLIEMIPEAMKEMGIGGAKNFEINYANNGVNLQIKVGNGSTEPVEVKQS
jgi:hypothetical protein